MSNAPLLVRPSGPHGQVHGLTPANLKDRCPNWGYVGFELHRLAAGETAQVRTDAEEHLLVVIEGSMTLKIDDSDFGVVGKRGDIFSREKGYAAYIPGGGHDWQLRAETTLEVAVCKAPWKGGSHPVRLIKPDASRWRPAGRAPIPATSTRS